MTIEELSSILKDNGICGAGGAGFPTYAKLDGRADAILLNCAECEPLLSLHHQLLQTQTYEILQAFSMIARTVGAKEAVIGIKKEYTRAIRAMEEYREDFPEIRIHLLAEAYPMGDEVVLVYEALNKKIRPGGLPIEAGVAVFNVETVYNVWQAVNHSQPVTHKLVTITGEVYQPVTLYLPLGCTVKEAVAMAGGSTLEQPAYLIGGPMMGKIGYDDTLITKTTNAVLVLPQDHLLIQRKNRKSSIDMKRAASCCCQCRMCTDLCPRHQLGHPIEPHHFMRAAANKDFQDVHAFTNTMYCSSCGVCETYACPQSLSPRSLIADYKDGLRKAGVRPEKITAEPEINLLRDARRVPKKRLKARLGLAPYEDHAPLEFEKKTVRKVKLLLGQHIGAPSAVSVQQGDRVEAGQIVADAQQGLSLPLHTPIAGEVTQITKNFICIEMRDGKDIG